MLWRINAPRAESRICHCAFDGKSAAPLLMPLPFDLGPWAVLWMAFVLFGAAFVRGYSGFGFAALVVSGAALVTDPFHFVPVVLIVDIFLTGAQLRSIRGRIDWRRVGFLFAGAVAGVPVGLWVLSLVTPDQARAAIAVFVLIACLLLWQGWTLRRKVGAGAHVAAGVVSGLANAAAVGGLPVALFFAAQGVPAAIFRATLIVYFTCLDLWTVPLMAAQGMIGRDTLITSALAMPVLLLGVWLGGRQFLRSDPADFRRFAIALLAGLSILGLVKSAF